MNGGIITGVSQFACPRCGLLSMYRTAVMEAQLGNKLGEPFVHPVPEPPPAAPPAKQPKA
jgi:hypothetical protein